MKKAFYLSLVHLEASALRQYPAQAVVVKAKNPPLEAVPSALEKPLPPV